MDVAMIVIAIVTVLGGLLYVMRKHTLHTGHNELYTIMRELDPPYGVSGAPDNLIHPHNVSANSDEIEFDGPGDGFACVIPSNGTNLPGFSKKDDCTEN